MLVDTSVWIDHFQRRSATLFAALEDGEVLCHPFVLGELACGNMKNRAEVLALLTRLPRAIIATDEEVLLYIEQHRIMGSGIGYIDAHLLTSVALTDGARLWTRDKKLQGLTVV